MELATGPINCDAQEIPSIFKALICVLKVDKGLVRRRRTFFVTKLKEYYDKGLHQMSGNLSAVLFNGNVVSPANFRLTEPDGELQALADVFDFRTTVAEHKAAVAAYLKEEHKALNFLQDAKYLMMLGEWLGVGGNWLKFETRWIAVTKDLLTTFTTHWEVQLDQLNRNKKNNPKTVEERAEESRIGCPYEDIAFFQQRLMTVATIPPNLWEELE